MFLEVAALLLFEEVWSRHLKPDVISYSAALSACQKGEQWLAALTLLKEMRNQTIRPNEATYCTAISASEKGRLRTTCPRHVTGLKLRSESGVLYYRFVSAKSDNHVIRFAVIWYWRN